jgi:hypothetical protein
MHSEDYLYRSTRTIYRMRQISDLAHNSHGDAIDTCQASMRVTPQRWSSPCQLPANHL